MFALEHSKSAYRADFTFYGAVSAALAGSLLLAGPRDQRLGLAVLALAGMAGWTFVEYVLHRFVLHRVAPFRTWHAEHHRRPTALVCTPTILSAGLIIALVFVPGLIVGGLWPACAVTFGMLTGYLAYAIVHHAVHHWHFDNAWLGRRKRSHALHHGGIHRPGNFGVTSAFWDHVCRSHHARQRIPIAIAGTPDTRIEPAGVAPNGLPGGRATASSWMPDRVRAARPVVDRDPA
jgi:sterol desaturase/sphingolipid hydroxylase (fatty acid hydroxylase superfamily)